jgi:predicted TIM-barrel fold metal-dependent hydrolase
MITTPFGQQRIFDAHTHFLGPSFLARLASQLGGDADAAEVARRLEWETFADGESLAHRWLAEMDCHGVDRIISIHTLPGDVEEAARGLAAARGRLAGYAMINPLAPGAPEQLSRAVTLGFAGVALFPAMFRFSLASDTTYAIYQIAHDHRLNVFVHCGVLKVGFRTKLGLATPFDGTFANPLHLQRAAAEFPEARFIIPHLGSGFFRELLMLADQSPNVFTDTSGMNGWAKYLDGSPTPAAVLKQAVNVMGAHRILFGTDSTFFPRGWRRDVFDQQLAIFREAGLSDEQVAMILGENLERLMGT